ncbi:hypothetical protein TWF730_000364 [Orbilia blumenaviensis]|uniref:Uncharacterized protein n=1 Tax=Orbilia blumenaviensis TaxID=1796055 RepID=A0AAV9VMD5_9PEZI
MAEDFTMTDTAIPPPSSHTPAAPKLPHHSYLLAYLQKCELAETYTDKKKNFKGEIPTFPPRISVSNGSSLHSSRDSLDNHGADDNYEDPESARSARNSLMLGEFWAKNNLTHDSSDDAADNEGLEDDYDDYDDDDDSDSYQDPDELTNLPYKSPAVFELPGSGNGNKYRTLVRDGPFGSVEGQDQRFVVIKRRSFRGAGLYPGDMVDMDVEMGGCVVLDDVEEEDYEDHERLEGEVEVMWSENGEEFWLVRNPAADGGIGRETSWVSKEWFMLRRKMMGKGQSAKDKERVELRVAMEED